MICALEEISLLEAQPLPRTKIPEVLVVEDDLGLEPFWSHLIHQAHKRARVHWVTSEEEAEAKIEQSIESGNKVDLVITDIYLNGSKTGIDLWSRFYADLRGNMIVTSGMDYQKFANYVKGSLHQPLFLKKPLNPPECIAAVYEMLVR